MKANESMNEFLESRDSSLRWRWGWG